MTDKQFNYILRRLRDDVMRSIYDKSFHVNDESMYIGCSRCVSLEDVKITLDTYFVELIEDE